MRATVGHGPGTVQATEETVESNHKRTPNDTDGCAKAGNVYFFDAKLIGADGRANPQFIAPPTTPGQQGQYVYLYGPGLRSVDLGLAKRFGLTGNRALSFEALFINAFNQRNAIVGLAGGATLSIDSTTFGQSTGTAIGARQIQFRLGVNF